MDLTESRSRAFFRRVDDSRAARESSTRAYESRRGKPEVRGASRVTQRAFKANLERHSEKAPDDGCRERPRTRGSARDARSCDAGSERGESGCG